MFINRIRQDRYGVYISIGIMLYFGREVDQRLFL